MKKGTKVYKVLKVIEVLKDLKVKEVSKVYVEKEVLKGTQELQ